MELTILVKYIELIYTYHFKRFHQMIRNFPTIIEVLEANLNLK